MMMTKSILGIAFFATLATGCMAETSNDPIHGGGEGEEHVASESSALGESGTIRGLDGKCLDVIGGDYSVGALLNMYPCHGGPAQQWVLTAAGEIRGLGGKCLDVRWGDTTPGTRVWMYPCTGSPAQQFTIDYTGVIHGLGDLCLDVQWGSMAVGTPVQMWSCNNDPAQKWSFSLPGTARGSILSMNEVLYTGDYLLGGGRKLVMQTDCNLVLYQGFTPLWSTDTVGGGRQCQAIMQSDGNFVVYNENHTALWASNTVGYANAHVVLQSDGNVVAYAGTRAIWATNTQRAPVSGGTGGISDPACRFARTDTKCEAITLWCKNVYACGFDSNWNPIERDDGWYWCGLCSPKIDW
jgi:hypothetical protein